MANEKVEEVAVLYVLQTFTCPQLRKRDLDFVESHGGDRRIIAEFDIREEVERPEISKSISG